METADLEKGLRFLIQDQQKNKKRHYPEILWEESSDKRFTTPTYGLYWQPDPNVPVRLNALEAAEYTAAYARKHRHPNHSAHQTYL